jgi:shikimate dehydrogenase
VNATSIGMGETHPDATAAPFPVELISKGQVVADLVMHPVETPLLRAATARGAQAVDGVGMLVHQAAIAFRHWTGVDPPVEVMHAAARSRLS